MMWPVLLVALSQPVAIEEPFAGELLQYSVNWPSGLSLGEASLHARRLGESWELEFILEGGVPGFAIADRYRSLSSDGFCALELEKQFQHGKKQGRERTRFDRERGVAVRETLGGGKSEIPATGCPHDALGFLYYLRQQLRQGRLPPAQEIFFGAKYQVNLRYVAFENVRVNDVPMQAERYQVRLKGPASEHSFDLYFARDAARTPVLVRVTFPLGTFSMELVR